MTTNELLIAVAAVVAFLAVAAIERRRPGGNVLAIERALAFVMIAGALGGGGYVLATGVAALNQSSSTVPGATSTSNTSAASSSESTATGGTSDPSTADPASSSSDVTATSNQTASAASSSPSSQAAISDASGLLKELMVFVLAFVVLGVLLLVGGIPWATSADTNHSDPG